MGMNQECLRVQTLSEFMRLHFLPRRWCITTVRRLGPLTLDIVSGSVGWQAGELGSQFVPRFQQLKLFNYIRISSHVIDS